MILSDKIIKRIEENIMSKANVIGYSKKLRKKIKNGQEIDEWAIVIYVSQKLPKELLHPKDIIPESVLDIKTDVIEIGEVKALEDNFYQKKWRPIILGISIGNAKITAGTLGVIYLKNNEFYLGSNAHVFTPDASKYPNEIYERRITQPGIYDIQRLYPNDDWKKYIIAEYVWHQRITPLNIESECPLSQFTVKILNGISYLFKRQTRFKAIIPRTVNNIDFAVAKPIETWNIEYLLHNGTKTFHESDYGYIGHVFAGSDKISAVVKGKYIRNLGFIPIGYQANYRLVTPKEGMIIEKIGRTTGYTNAKIIDDSAVLKVNYGKFTALFEDIILTEKFVEGGDSGSGVFTRLR